MHTAVAVSRRLRAPPLFVFSRSRRRLRIDEAVAGRIETEALNVVLLTGVTLNSRSRIKDVQMEKVLANRREFLKAGALGLVFGPMVGLESVPVVIAGERLMIPRMAWAAQEISSVVVMALRP